MEDVVLHYHPGSAAGLSGLLERTERLLRSFPCRTPPVFSPWFPTATAGHPPIRPAQPAPVITGPAAPLISARAAQNQLQEPEVPGHQPPPEDPPEPEDAACVSEVVGHSPLKRSWSVFTQRGVQQNEALSKPFRRTVSVHRLHLHQRAKWVIGRHNCGGARDIEQVWRALSRCVRSSGLTTCNANIRRDRAEIWVFCDVVRSEQVGRFLKEELQLSGRIELSAHRRGNIFSM